MIPASTQPPFTQLQSLTVITAATQAQSRPPAESVVAALLAVEKAAKQERCHYRVESLLGNWQLCFTTGTRKRPQGGIKLSRGFYLPQFVQAQIGFAAVAESNALSISNQLQLGTLCFRLTGPARYLTLKNLLAFDFTQMQLSLLGRNLYRGQFGSRDGSAFDQKPIAKLPFFSFFLITPDFIAARGRGGGLAIWVRVTAP